MLYSHCTQKEKQVGKHERSCLHYSTNIGKVTTYCCYLIDKILMLCMYCNSWKAVMLCIHFFSCTEAVFWLKVSNQVYSNTLLITILTVYFYIFLFRPEYSKIGPSRFYDTLTENDMIFYHVILHVILLLFSLFYYHYYWYVSNKRHTKIRRPHTHGGHISIIIATFFI